LPPASSSSASFEVFARRCRKARSSIAALRTIVPGANLLVYDNYNALAIAFSENDRVGASLGPSLSTRDWVSCFSVGGQKLPDPKKLLRAEGARCGTSSSTTFSITTPAGEEAPSRRDRAFACRTFRRRRAHHHQVISKRQRPRRMVPEAPNA